MKFLGVKMASKLFDGRAMRLLIRQAPTLVLFTLFSGGVLYGVYAFADTAMASFLKHRSEEIIEHNKAVRDRDESFVSLGNECHVVQEKSTMAISAQNELARMQIQSNNNVAESLKLQAHTNGEVAQTLRDVNTLLREIRREKGL